MTEERSYEELEVAFAAASEDRVTLSAAFANAIAERDAALAQVNTLQLRLNTLQLRLDAADNNFHLAREQVNTLREALSGILTLHVPYGSYEQWSQSGDAVAADKLSEYDAARADARAVLAFLSAPPDYLTDQADIAPLDESLHDSTKEETP